MRLCERAILQTQGTHTATLVLGNQAPPHIPGAFKIELYHHEVVYKWNMEITEVEFFI